MQTLWALGTGTVHEIRSRLLPERPLAYTTVLTIMGRLAGKGIVDREKRGRAHLYRPVVAEDLICQKAIDRLAWNFFQGSREQLRQYLEAGKTGSALAKPGKAEQVVPPAIEAAPAEKIDPTLL